MGGGEGKQDIQTYYSLQTVHPHQLRYGRVVRLVVAVVLVENSLPLLMGWLLGQVEV